MEEGTSVVDSCACSDEVDVGTVGKTGSGVEVCGACDCCIIVAEAVVSVVVVVVSLCCSTITSEQVLVMALVGVVILML